MLGLMKNHLYAGMYGIKIALGTTILLAGAGVVLLSAGEGLPMDIFFAYSVVMLPFLAVCSISPESGAKWSSFELTLPISKKDAVGAQYVMYFCFMVIGLLISFVSFGVNDLINPQVVSVPKMIFSFVLSVQEAFIIGSVGFLLLILFGQDKREVMFLLAFFISVPFSIGFRILLAIYDIWYFPILIVVSSALLYILSYLISVAIYKKKDF